jgi:osmotically-inducible protein OsmY
MSIPVENSANRARPVENLPVRSGSQVFCADDPRPVGKVDSSSRSGAKGERLLVSTGRWHRVVRRVPSESVVSADAHRIQLNVPRAEFLNLPHYLPDQEVVASVSDSFKECGPFRYSGAASITITSRDGAVTLSGHVSHEGHRKQAVECAERADGVVSLSDRLISDEHLTSSVARSFVPYPGLQASLVRVSARLGTVGLEGELASQELIGLATSTTCGVAGVAALDNRLRLDAPRTP